MQGSTASQSTVPTGHLCKAEMTQGGGPNSERLDEALADGSVAITGLLINPFSILINPRIYIKSFLGIACAVCLMAAKEKRLTTRSEIPNPQATGQSELPLRDEFVAETLQAISELDQGLAKTYSSKKKFLDDLERL